MEEMNYNDEVSLVHVEYIEDTIGQQVPTETLRVVFCNIESVSSREFFEAGRNGLSAEKKITMRIADYDNEAIVQIGNFRYGIYRTFVKDLDTIELYLERKEGVR